MTNITAQLYGNSFVEVEAICFITKGFLAIANSAREMSSDMTVFLSSKARCILTKASLLKRPDESRVQLVSLQFQSLLSLQL